MRTHALQAMRCCVRVVAFVCALALAGLAGTALAAPAAPAGQGWLASYRDAYQAMIRFEKYGKPKQLIQQHYQVVARDRHASLDGLHLTLLGHALQLDLPLDGAGRAVLPLLKAAYDENAELTLNRPASQYAGRARVSIAPRADGIYDAGELRAACEQVRAFLLYANDAAVQGKKCSAVRFSYPKNGPEPELVLRGADGAGRRLAVNEGTIFQDDGVEQFRTVTVPLAALPDRARVLTRSAPLAIAAWFE